MNLEFTFFAYSVGTLLIGYSFFRYYSRKTGFPHIKGWLDKREKEIHQLFEEKIRSIEDASIHVDVDLKRHQQLSRIAGSELENIERQMTRFEEIHHRLNKYLEHFNDKEKAIRELTSETNDHLKILGNYKSDIKTIFKDVSHTKDRLNQLESTLNKVMMEVTQGYAKKVVELESEAENKISNAGQKLFEQFDILQQRLSKSIDSLETRTHSMLEEYINTFETEKVNIKNSEENALSLLRDRLEKFFSEERESSKLTLDAERQKFKEEISKVSHRMNEVALSADRVENKLLLLSQSIETSRQELTHQNENFSEELLSKLQKKVSSYQETITDDLKENAEKFISEIELLDKKLHNTEEYVIHAVDEKFSNILKSINEYEVRLENKIGSITEEYEELKTGILDQSSSKIELLSERCVKLDAEIAKIEESRESSRVSFEAILNETKENLLAEKEEWIRNFKKETDKLSKEKRERAEEFFKKATSLKKEMEYFTTENKTSIVSDRKEILKQTEAVLKQTADLAAAASASYEDFETQLSQLYASSKHGIEDLSGKLFTRLSKETDDFTQRQSSIVTFMEDAMRTLDMHRNKITGDFEKLATSRIELFEEKKVGALDELLTACEKFEKQFSKNIEDKISIRSNNLLEQLSNKESSLLELASSTESKVGMVSAEAYKQILSTSAEAQFKIEELVSNTDEKFKTQLENLSQQKLEELITVVTNTVAQKQSEANDYLFNLQQKLNEKQLEAEEFFKAIANDSDNCLKSAKQNLETIEQVASELQSKKVLQLNAFDSQKEELDDYILHAKKESELIYSETKNSLAQKISSVQSEIDNFLMSEQTNFVDSLKEIKKEVTKLSDELDTRADATKAELDELSYKIENVLIEKTKEITRKADEKLQNSETLFADKFRELDLKLNSAVTGYQTKVDSYKDNLIYQVTELGKSVSNSETALSTLGTSLSATTEKLSKLDQKYDQIFQTKLDETEKRTEDLLNQKSEDINKLFAQITLQLENKSKEFQNSLNEKETLYAGNVIGYEGKLETLVNSAEGKLNHLVSTTEGKLDSIANEAEAKFHADMEKLSALKIDQFYTGVAEKVTEKQNEANEYLRSLQQKLNKKQIEAEAHFKKVADDSETYIQSAKQNLETIEQVASELKTKKVLQLSAFDSQKEELDNFILKTKKESDLAYNETKKLLSQKIGSVQSEIDNFLATEQKSFVDSLKEIKKEVTKLSDELDTRTDATKTELDELSYKIENVLIEKTKEISRKADEKLQNSETLFADKFRELDLKLNSAVTGYQTKVDSYKENLISQITEFGKSVSNSENNISTLNAKVNNAEGKLNLLFTETEGKLDSIANDAEKKFNADLEKLSALKIDQFYAGVAAKVTEKQNEATEYLRELQQKLNEKQIDAEKYFKTATESSENSLQLAKANFDKILDITKELEEQKLLQLNSFDNQKNIFENSLKDMDKSSKDLLSQTNASYQAKIESIEKEMKERFSKEQKDLENSLNKLKDDLTLASKEIYAINENSFDAQQTISKRLDELFSEKATAISQLANKQMEVDEAMIQKRFNELDARFSAASSLYEDKLNSQKELMLEQVNELSKILTIQKENSLSLKEHLYQSENKLGQLDREFKAYQEAKFESLSEEALSIFDQKKVELENLFKNLSNDFEKKSDVFDATLISKTNSYDKHILDSQERLLEMVQTTKTHITNALSNSDDLLIKHIENIAGKKIETLINSITDSVQEKEDALISYFDSVNESVEKKRKETDSMINLILTSAQKDIHSAKDYVAQMELILSELEEKKLIQINAFESDKELLSNYIRKVDSELNGLKKSADDTLSANIVSLQKEIDSFLNEEQNNFKSNLEHLSKQVTKISNEFELKAEHTNSEIESISERLQTVFDDKALELSKSTDQILELNEKQINLKLAEIEKSFTSVTENLKTITEEKQKNVEILIEELRNKVTENIEYSTQANSQVTHFESKIESLDQRLDGLFVEKVEELKNVNIESIEASKKAISEIFQNKVDNIDAIANSCKTEFVQFAQEEKNKMEEVTRTLSSSVEQILVDYNARYQNSDKDFNSLRKDLSELFASKSDDLLQKLSIDANLYNNKLSQVFNNLSNDFESRLKDLDLKFDQKEKSLFDRLCSLDNKTGEREEIANALYAEILKAQTTFSKNLQKNIDDSLDLLKGKEGEISANIDSLEKSSNFLVKDLLKSVTNIITSEHNAFENKLNEAINSAETRLNDYVQSYSAKEKECYDTLQTNLNSKTSVLEKQVLSTIVSKLDRMSSEVLSKYDQKFEAYQKQINHIDNEMLQVSKTVQKEQQNWGEISTKIQSTKKEAEQQQIVLSSQLADLNKSKNEFLNFILENRKLLDSHLSDLKSNTKNSSSLAIQEFKKELTTNLLEAKKLTEELIIDFEKESKSDYEKSANENKIRLSKQISLLEKQVSDKIATFVRNFDKEQKNQTSLLTSLQKRLELDLVKYNSKLNSFDSVQQQTLNEFSKQFQIKSKELLSEYNKDIKEKKKQVFADTIQFQKDLKNESKELKNNKKALLTNFEKESQKDFAQQRNLFAKFIHTLSRNAEQLSGNFSNTLNKKEVVLKSADQLLNSIQKRNEEISQTISVFENKINKSFSEFTNFKKERELSLLKEIESLQNSFNHRIQNVGINELNKLNASIQEIEHSTQIKLDMFEKNLQSCYEELSAQSSETKDSFIAIVKDQRDLLNMEKTSVASDKQESAKLLIQLEQINQEREKNFQKELQLFFDQKQPSVNKKLEESIVGLKAVASSELKSLTDDFKTRMANELEKFESESILLDQKTEQYLITSKTKIINLSEQFAETISQNNALIQSELQNIRDCSSNADLLLVEMKKVLESLQLTPAEKQTILAQLKNEASSILDHLKKEETQQFELIKSDFQKKLSLFDERIKESGERVERIDSLIQETHSKETEYIATFEKELDQIRAHSVNKVESIIENIDKLNKTNLSQLNDLHKKETETFLSKLQIKADESITKLEKIAENKFVQFGTIFSSIIESSEKSSKKQYENLVKIEDHLNKIEKRVENTKSSLENLTGEQKKLLTHYQRAYDDYHSKVNTLNGRFEDAFKNNKEKIDTIFEEYLIGNKKIFKNYFDNKKTEIDSQFSELLKRASGKEEQYFLHVEKEKVNATENINQLENSFNQKLSEIHKNLALKEDAKLSEITKLQVDLNKDLKDYQTRFDKLSKITEENIEKQNSNFIKFDSYVKENQKIIQKDFSDFMLRTNEKYNTFIEFCTSKFDDYMKRFRKEVKEKTEGEVEKFEASLLKIQNQLKKSKEENDEFLFKYETQIKEDSAKSKILLDKSTKNIENDILQKMTEFQNLLKTEVSRVRGEISGLDVKKDKRYEKFENTLAQELEKYSKYISKLDEKYINTEEKILTKNSKMLDSLFSKIEKESTEQLHLAEETISKLELSRKEIEQQIKVSIDKTGELELKNHNSISQMKSEIEKMRSEYISKTEKLFQETLKTFVQKVDTDIKTIIPPLEQKVSDINKTANNISLQLLDFNKRLDDAISQQNQVISNSRLEIEKLQFELNQNIQSGFVNSNEKLSSFIEKSEQSIHQKIKSMEQKIEKNESEISGQVETRFIELNSQIESILEKVNTFIKHTGLYDKVDELDFRIKEEIKNYEEKLLTIQDQSKELTHFENELEAFNKTRTKILAETQDLDVHLSQAEELGKRLTAISTMLDKIETISNEVTGRKEELTTFYNEFQSFFELGQTLEKGYGELALGNKSIKEMMATLEQLSKENSHLAKEQEGTLKEAEMLESMQAKISRQLEELASKANQIEARHDKLGEFAEKYDRLEHSLLDVERRSGALEKLKKEIEVQTKSLQNIKTEIDAKIREAIAVRNNHPKTTMFSDAANGNAEKTNKKNPELPKNIDIETIRFYSQDMKWSVEQIAKNFNLDKEEVQEILDTQK